MKKVELNLLDNAVDSLNEALSKYQQGNDGDLKAFKFSVLHFSHFFELILKYYVSLSHELLIYKNPFSKKISKENTIGIWDAVQFLKNEGHEFDREFMDDLKWFKELRNNIEHHEFSLDVDLAKKVLGRLMQTFNEFDSILGEVDLKSKVTSELMEQFDILADEYKANVRRAVEQAKEAGGLEEDYYCSGCDQAGTLSLKNGMYICHFCGEESVEVDCCVCGVSFPKDELMVWNDDSEQYVDYICQGCESRIQNM
ncbi:hypothetical protein [Pleionea sp. CnH1-48]|uniref:hypothetical protein n=1 Tax=Pleionea sp. CnH1-48 TaxID=2954494 RepID=UPI0020983622|nr:hypothetical protein [Pleionea sp. CnH1-48]MCO7225941.1 hypothetical protein [Pleionea sp. CnH1-48]